MLLERLQAITIDESMWESALTSTQQGNYQEIQRVDAQIKQEKSTQDNIIATLGRLTNDEMIYCAQANYVASARRIEMLKAELENMRRIDRREKVLVRARPALIRIAENWEHIPGNEWRNIFEEFAEYIHISRVNRTAKRIRIHWRQIRDMYHFGKGRRFTEIYNVFGGKKRNERRYKNHERWEDTEAYQATLA